MHRDVERRYRTVDALARDVDRFLQGRPLVARADTVRYRLGKFVRRRRVEVLVAAAVFIAIAGLVSLYTVRLAVARNEAVTYATRAQRIQKFILNLFEGGDPEAGPSDKLLVSTLVDRGVQEARTLSNEPVVQADMYQTLGSIYQKLGNLDRSDELLREALARRQAIDGPSSPNVAETLTARGLLFVDEAQFDEAERRALETAREGD
jgi:serine/threonine-protein kinase